MNASARTSARVREVVHAVVARRRLLPTAVLLAVLAAATAANAQEPAQVVRMTDQMKFVPARVTVHVGDTVEWKSDSVLVHTVTASPSLAADKQDVSLPQGAEPFNSGNIPPGGTFAHTFRVAGTYRYFCIPHEAAGMLGTVVVKPH